MSGRVSPKVVVASDDDLLMDEIVRYLEEIPQWRLVSSARSVEELSGALAAGPDAVIVSDRLAGLIASERIPLSVPRVVIVGREAGVEALRAALEVGASGFVEWPAESRKLRGLVERGLSPPSRTAPARGSLVGLWGPKGGSGTSVLAAHLAGALARLARPCVLVDLDLDHGDQSAILGAGEAKGFLDLLRVVDEITPSALESVAWRHPSGFGAVLTAGGSGEADLVKVQDAVRVLTALAELTEYLVADLPSGFAEIVLPVAEAASRLFFVLTPDVLSLRRAKEAIRMVRSAGIDPSRVEIILNRAGGDIGARDAEAVVGRPVVAEVRPDYGLSLAPDRGELAASGLKHLDPLARRLAGVPKVAPRGPRRFIRR